MKTEKKLVEDIDRGMFARMTEGKETDVDSLLAELTNARFKIDGLSIRQLLLKDAKHITVDKNRVRTNLFCFININRSRSLQPLFTAIWAIFFAKKKHG